MPEEAVGKPDPVGGFIENSLGPGSSHPAFTVRRLRAARSVAFGIGSLLATVVAWHLHRLLQGQWQLGDLSSFLPAMATRKSWTLGMVFAISAALTAALTIRASLVRRTAAPPRSNHMAWSEGIGLFLSLFILCALLAWLGRPGFLSLKARVGLLVAGLLPLHLLRWWFARQSRSNPVTGGSGLDDEGIALVRSLRGLINSVVALAFSLLALGEVAEPVSRWFLGFIQPMLSNLSVTGGFASLQPWIAPFAAVFARHVTSAIMVYLFQLMGAVTVMGMTLSVLSSIDDELRRHAEAANVDGVQPSPPRTRARARSPLSLWQRIREWFLQRFFRHTPVQEPPPFDGPSDAWAAQLQERFNRDVGAVPNAPVIGVRWIPDPAGRYGGGYARMHDWRWVFGNRSPSVSQGDCFQRFQDLWQSAQLKSYAALAAPDSHRREIGQHADLFIESPGRGAGMTTLLHACAIYAAAARGQRVLLLVADEEEKSVQRQAIEKVLSDAEFHHLIRVGGLSPEEVTRYCGPRARAGYRMEQLPPEILVATPDEYDSAFLDSHYDDVRIRALLLSIEVILIDGLDRMMERRNLRWLVHLPFVLDKHRLALSCEGRMGQVVVGGGVVAADDPDRDLPSVARQRLALRLFGGDGSMSGRFLRLKRFDHPPLDALEITIRGPTRQEELLPSLLDELRTVAPSESVGYVRLDGVPIQLPAGLEALEFRELMSAGNALGTEFFGTRSIRWLVLPGDLSDENRTDLYLRLNQTKPEGVVLLVFVCPDQHPPPAAAPPVFPVFVSPEASALLVSHLFSILPVLRVDAPIRREKFARFGLNWDPRRLVEHTRGRRGGKVEKSVDWEIEWDGDLGALLRGAASSAPWPAVFVRRDLAANWKGTGLRWPVDEGICLDFDDQKQTIHKALVRAARINARYATWMSPRGLVLHTSDLFLQERFVLETEDASSNGSRRRRYFPVKIAPHSREPAGTGSDAAVGIPDPAGGTNRNSCGVLIEVQEETGSPIARPERPDVVTRVELKETLFVDGPYRVAAGPSDWEEWVFRWVPDDTSGTIESEECLRGLVSSDGRERLASSGNIVYRVETGVSMVILGGGGDTGGDSDALRALVRARFGGNWETGPRPDGTLNSRAVFWPLLTECIQSAVAACAPRLQDFCRIFAFHPVRMAEAPADQLQSAVEGRETEKAVLIILENPATLGTSLEVMRTLLDDRDLRQRLLESMARRLGERRLTGAGMPSADFVGPKDNSNADGDSVRQMDDLLESMGCMAATGPDFPPGPQRSSLLGLPVPPLHGRYRCGNCNASFDLSGATMHKAARCSRCHRMLFHLEPSVGGRLRYPMQFFSGLRWRGSERSKEPPGSRDRLLEIWRDVASSMTYEHDPAQHLGRSDVWHTSAESLDLKKGDCEDHAILLADWLIAEGYQARVACGTMTGRGVEGGEGGHAWVVVRLDGVEYHLEATAKEEKPIAPVSDVESVWPGRAYRAVFQFDPNNFWVRHFETPDVDSPPPVAGDRSTGETRSFWDESAWECGLFLRTVEHEGPNKERISHPGPAPFES
jgi:hypothetical protein